MMTIKQLKKAMQKHNYIACRFANGKVAGYNCRVLPMLLKKEPNPQVKTWVVSYRKISLNQYINIKAPY